MSKVKKILAVLLTLAMVMGLNITTFAAEPTAGSITINNAGAGTFEYLQLIQTDNTTETGWAFTTPAIAGNYKTAFSENSDQAVIKKLIEAAKPGTTTPYTSEIAAALNAVEVSGYSLTQTASNPFTVDAAGVYYVKGTEDKYAYSPMAAYISFGDSLGYAELEAKKAPTSVEKSADDKDKVTEIGRTVPYNVKTTVPYIPAEKTNAYYVFKDTIEGATYNVNADGDLPVKVTIGSKVIDYTAVVTDNSFVLDLSDLLKDNRLANVTITVSYEVTVTDVKVYNEIKVGDSLNDPNNKYGSDDEKLYTGEIQLIKYAADDTDTLDDNEKLANADFIVYRDNEGTKEYAVFNGVKFKEWTAAEADATTLTTDKDGNIKVEGLDVGTYFFKETKAPDGYSVNTTDVSVTLTQEGQATDTVTANPATMLDTKLSALPGTGGIGTTIFTIGGVLIMIIAAGLFFASRKKSSK